MGEVLAGNHAVWEFHTDSVLIRFERGIRTPRLWSALGQRRIPYDALAAVTVTPGKRDTVVLQAVPRPGADPLMDAAAGQLRENSDPYRLVLPAERTAAAAGLADELRSAMGPDADEPAARFLVPAPEVPIQFKGYDAKAVFDGSAVVFRWSRTGASSTKWKAGDQYFGLDGICGVEWRSPEEPGGYLRLQHREGSGPGGAAAGAVPADQDPSAVLFGLGYGAVYESLPFAAAVLRAVRGRGPALPVAAVRPARRDPADIAERIRHLGELHGAGLLTDVEFTSKKAELLAEL
ncbi:DUF4429 domain-containing protein [Streptomyces bambusae]|uniref:DUF4429 domain-containing protein n=1 Tax=Streptomyces bambusae TaxID=1550616 RepID=UPI001CFC678C|nr:DUF4429 domain-containing protein [Streptomyces bambusae]MCB5164879.1 DUF4429 domain-containing protein [Streptomyces bambusae]